MTTSTIEELAYLLKQAKEKKLPQPIVFLGAGASKTGGVPLPNEIIKDILKGIPERKSPKAKATATRAHSRDTPLKYFPIASSTSS